MERRKLLLAGATAVAGAMTSNALAQSTASSLPDRFAAALSAHDIKAFADLFAEDYVNHQFSAAAPAPASGKSQKQASVDLCRADRRHARPSGRGRDFGDFRRSDRREFCLYRNA
jgi:hypothetical protein